MEDDEMRTWQVTALPAVAAQIGEYYHAPITDNHPPGRRFEAAWLHVGPVIRHRLQSGAQALIHCRGGLGRTGTVAARILMEFGLGAAQAAYRVRNARPGAIETFAQEAYLRNLEGRIHAFAN